MFPTNKEITMKTAKMLNVLALLLAAVFVMAFAMATNAHAFSITGKVVAINTDKETISVAAYYGPDYALSYSGGADRLGTFAFKHDGVVMRGSQRLHFRDIRVGDWVTVNYYEEGAGRVVAGGISVIAPPVAYAGETAQMFSLPGRVVSIDRDARTLTVDPSYYYGPSYGGPKLVRVFTVDRDMVIMAGNEPRDFRDIRVGDWVSVTFHQEGNGVVVADEIAITAPPAPYVGETSRAFSIPGKVVAIDRESRTLTLDPSYCSGANYGGVTGLRLFAVASGTEIMLGSEPRDFRDIRVGDWVTVNFHQERNGLVITDEVAFTSPITCTENRG